MYTDHRVMGQVVLPGVSHVSLMAATASLGFPSPGGGMGDWHISVKDMGHTSHVPMSQNGSLNVPTIRIHIRYMMSLNGYYKEQLPTIYMYIYI